MDDRADVLKYFYEEPAALEPIVPDHDPDARRRGERTDVPPDEAILHGDPFHIEQGDAETPYRGYLTGTNHAENRVGLTALRRPAAFVEPFLAAFGGSWWARGDQNGSVESLSPGAVRRVLREPGSTRILVSARAPVPDEAIAAVAVQDPERTRTALNDLLGAVRIALFPEPAHDEWDWRLWSDDPMRERLTAAFRDRPVSEVRRFVISAADARSESKFYFDMWHPADTDLPEYVEEV